MSRVPERMLKAVVQGDESPATTKQRIVEAAFQTLKEEGFAGTSARAIARRGGFNQALIFYHFGTLNDLLLATLDKTSGERMSRYRDSMGKAHSVDEKIQTATRLYREDLSSGHITVISEMVAGSLARPDLGPEVVARMEPWIEFTEEVIRDLLEGSMFSGTIKPRTLAFAVVALYLGVDLLSHLDQDKSRAEALFEMAGGIGPLLAPMFGGGSTVESPTA
ncbi:MAG: TetR/AcrR family transcriptional regulator [Actinomycetota bacterium]|nr:TetR/AcrR family transcriptional regulator [Actinomycetota bacterium]